jgi:flagellar basal body-associated protein FliL
MLFIICYKYVKQKLYKLKNKNMIVVKIILLVVMVLCGLGAIYCGFMALKNSKQK